MRHAVAGSGITEQSTSRTVQTSKWKLHFNEAGAGHPLILLHGTGTGATGWSNFSPNIGPLSRYYRVIAPDLPGWGGSDSFDPLADGDRRLAHAEAVTLLMDELGIEKAAVVGNSMGGGVALQLAMDHPHRLTHLITMGASVLGVPNIFTPGGMTEGIRILLETYRDPSPANFRRLVGIMVYDSSFVTDDLLEARSQAALSNRTHLENWLKPFQGKPVVAPVNGDMIAKLAKIELPSLFIHGRDDRVVPMETSLRLLSTVPNSRLHMFNRCGHWCQIEHTDEFNALVHNFINPNPELTTRYEQPAFGG